MIKKIATWILLALLCNFVVKILLLLDLNKESYGHLPGPCLAVHGIENGAYAIAHLKNGTVIATSGLRDRNQSELQTSTGKLFYYNMSAAELMVPVAQELKIISNSLTPEKFNPGGISVWSSKGRTSVYVINHHLDGDSIECFTFSDETKTLTHTKSVKDGLIYSAADVLAVGPDRFFVTNDHYFHFPVFYWLETVLMLNLGSIVFYDGQKAQLADQWLLSPTGLGQSKDKKWLYVASPFQESISVYKLKPDNSLSKHLDMALLTSPTNVFVDPDSGDLWTGCQPVMHKFLKFLWSPKSRTSPSQVLRVRPHESHDSWTITEVYANDGMTLSASTVAVHYDRRFVIGSRYGSMLACEISNPDTM